MDLKQKRTNSLIMETVSEIIERDLKDPRIGFVTVTSVKTSSDLKYATVYFTVHDGENEGKKNSELLNHARGFIQHKLSDLLRLKYTPKLHFEFNPFIERLERIEKLIKEENGKEN